MTATYACAFLAFLAVTGTAFTEDKPTSLADARSAVEANLRTPEGKAFDERFGKEFTQKHLDTMRQCKQNAGSDLASFWMLVKLAKDGTVKEFLLSPTTKLGNCAREALLKVRFSPPPRPEYWVSAYMKITR